VTQARGSTSTPERDSSSGKGGWFARIALFLRQVVAELRKVVWPTRSELITYTIVVLVFVVCFAVLVLFFDIGVSRVVSWIFG